MNFKEQRGITPDPAFSIFNVEVANIMVVALIASFASFLNYQASQRTWSWARFFAHISASLVSAFLTTTIATELGVVSVRILIAIAAIAGWAGVSGVNWVIYAVKMRALIFAGLTKAADRERYIDNSENKNYNVANSSNDDNAPTTSLRKKRVIDEKDNDNTQKD